MRILPGDAPDGSLVRPRAFHDHLVVRGLPTDALSALIRGEPAGRAAWRPGVVVTGDLAGSADRVEAQPRTIDLEDGRIVLTSGGGGRVEVGPGHALGDTRLPQCLHLLLAQQWARAGLMMIHGAAFRFQSTGVLVLGGQGAGKSTLTAAVLAAGGEIVSDDWLLAGAPADGAVRAERLRDFLMFRAAAPTERLLAALPELRLSRSRRGDKLIARFDRQPRHVQCRLINPVEIDRVWLLGRPDDDRPAGSTLAPAAGESALAAIIEATMPLLFSRRFPVERRALLGAVSRILARTPTSRVEPGTDLLHNPRTAIVRLLALESDEKAPKV